MLKTKKFGAKKLVAAASSLALVGGLAVATPAAADSRNISNASFTWKISECAFNTTLAAACGSLQQDQVLTGDVTRGTEGFEFSNGVGTYDPDTGDTEVSFSGSVQLGNEVQGGYGVKFVDPSISVQDGVGELTANIQTRNPSQPGTPLAPFVDKGRVTVLDLPSVPESSKWTAQPEELVSQDANLDPNPETPSFSYAFQGLFTGQLGGLRPWFRQSATEVKNEDDQSYNPKQYIPNPNNPNKVAADVSTQLYNPKVELVGASGIALNKTKTITVKGSGFNPESRTEGLYVVFGPEAAQVKPPFPPGSQAEQDNFYSAVPLLEQMGVTAPNDEGAFTAQLPVTGVFKNKAGKTFDARKTPLGVSVWAAHSNTIASYRSFTKINFAPGITTYIKPGKVKSLKRKLNKKRTKFKVSWAAPTATKVSFRNNKAVKYQVRVTNYKGKKYSKWKNTKKRYIVINMKRKGTYTVQVRAVGKKGAKGKARTASYKKLK